MAKLPPLKRLVTQDYAGQNWLAPLFQVLNNFMESTYSALNQALTLADNTTSGVLELVLTSQPTPTSPARLSWPKEVPVAVMIGNVQQRDTTQANRLTTSGALLTNAPGIEWQYISDSTGDYIYVTNLVGCPTPTSNLTITLTLVVITG